MDQWVLSRLADCVETVESSLKEYNFSRATTAMYTFWVHDLCDVYLELSKVAPSSHCRNMTRAGCACGRV